MSRRQTSYDGDARGVTEAAREIGRSQPGNYLLSIYSQKRKVGCMEGRLICSKYIRLQESVAELTLRIVMVEQVLKIWHPIV